MAPDYVTPALAALLRWIDNDPHDAFSGALYLGRFLSFGCRALNVDTVPRVPGSERLTSRQLEATRRELLRILDGAEPRSLRSLAFGVEGVSKAPAKLPRSEVQRRKVVDAMAYRLVVSGSRRDLTLYVLMRLLGKPGAAQLARCAAPAAGNRAAQCGRWFLARGAHRRGRPQTFCTPTCRKRAHRAAYD